MRIRRISGSFGWSEERGVQHLRSGCCASLAEGVQSRFAPWPQENNKAPDDKLACHQGLYYSYIKEAFYLFLFSK